MPGTPMKKSCLSLKKGESWGREKKGTGKKTATVYPFCGREEKKIEKGIFGMGESGANAARNKSGNLLGGDHV